MTVEELARIVLDPNYIFPLVVALLMISIGIMATDLYLANKRE